ncbi:MULTISPECIES: GNAT family N-acetyltransferase [Shimia]|uniref:GNAT family N-acetyltransferase n=1 Tax=Shimia TaxID=573139 RepID=UPI001FB3B6C7|nr:MULTISPECIES: GNAT family N-acetyltransferase [Shimia]MDV4143746.1 N-acetyltransferase family protein [Shimia sp. FJ5]
MMVRSARAGDVAAMAAIWNPIIRDTAITFTTEEKTAAGLEAMIAAPEGRWLVAEEDGVVLGFAGYGAFRGGPGYAHAREHTILLGEGARGRGVGRALMRALEAEARDAGIHVLVAGISAENPGAVAFHAALGFAEVGRMPEVGQKFDRWMALVLMQKIL